MIQIEHDHVGTAAALFNARCYQSHCHCYLSSYPRVHHPRHKTIWLLHLGGGPWRKNSNISSSMLPSLLIPNTTGNVCEYSHSDTPLHFTSFSLSSFWLFLSFFECYFSLFISLSIALGLRWYWMGKRIILLHTGETVYGQSSGLWTHPRERISSILHPPILRVLHPSATLSNIFHLHVRRPQSPPTYTAALPVNHSILPGPSI